MNTYFIWVGNILRHSWSAVTHLTLSYQNLYSATITIKTPLYLGRTVCATQTADRHGNTANVIGSVTADLFWPVVFNISGRPVNGAHVNVSSTAS